MAAARRSLAAADLGMQVAELSPMLRLSSVIYLYRARLSVSSYPSDWPEYFLSVVDGAQWHRMAVARQAPSQDIVCPAPTSRHA